LKLGIVFTLFISVFLFIGGPGAHELTVYREFWQLGHFVLFALTIFLLAQINAVKSQHWLVQILAVGVFCLTVGLVTEVLQRYFGRSFSLRDVFNDILGGYAGFFSAKILYLHQTLSSGIRKHRIGKQLGYSAAIVVLALFSGRFFIKAAINEINTRMDFPTLSNFETLFETNRWQGNYAYSSISPEFARGGGNGMRIKFLPARYPSIALVDFIGDWRGYRDLKLSMYNTEKEPIEVVLSIHDHQHHHTGYQFKDRFNKTIVLTPGWNDLSYSLEEIKNSPEDRQMDMNEMYSFSLYMVEIKQSKMIYLDNVYLDNVYLDNVYLDH